MRVIAQIPNWMFNYKPKSFIRHTDRGSGRSYEGPWFSFKRRSEFRKPRALLIICSCWATHTHTQKKWSWLAAVLGIIGSFVRTSVVIKDRIGTKLAIKTNQLTIRFFLSSPCLDHFEFDAPFPASDLSSHSARGRFGADSRHWAGVLPLLHLPRDHIHSGHCLPKPIGEYESSFSIF